MTVKMDQVPLGSTAELDQMIAGGDHAPLPTDPRIDRAFQIMRGEPGDAAAATPTPGPATPKEKTP